MLKSLVRRHRLVALPIFLVMGSAVLPWHQPGIHSNVIDPPAQIIIKNAISTDRGIQLEWLEGQPGKHPIKGYVVERGRANSGFTLIARVEKSSLKYLDAEGQPGDAYRVFAEDDQKPAKRSAASMSVVATPLKPGGAVLTATSTLNTTGPSIISQIAEPDVKADSLQKFITQAFIDFDTALNRHDMESARDRLIILQDYLRQALTLLPHLPPAQKIPLVNVCNQNVGIFEANAHTLTDQDQMDSMLVIAGCDAIVDSAE